MGDRSHPPASTHGELKELLPDIFFVTGSMQMAPLLAFSRNMVVIRRDTKLVLVNSMRLSEDGLKELDALGKVTDVVRLAGFHGMDDPFYKERYGATTWCLDGATYQKGFAAGKSTAQPYFTADRQITRNDELPIAGAKLIAFSTTPPEALLLLEREGGILISGDALQNWHQTDRYFSFMGSLMMKMMGFIKPHNLGPGWIKSTKPKPSEIHALLDLDFTYVLPAHGTPVLGGAKEKYRPVVEAFGARS